MHSHPGCKFMHLAKEYSVEDLAAFHGHLGPYIVLGYRIGAYVRTHLCEDPFQLSATVYCSGNPPESCIADGVQIGSGCTLGKRNISLIAGSPIRCEFSADGRRIIVVPRPFARPADGEHYALEIEKLAERMYYSPDEELFDVTDA